MKFNCNMHGRIEEWNSTQLMIFYSISIDGKYSQPQIPTNKNDE